MTIRRAQAHIPKLKIISFEKYPAEPIFDSPRGPPSLAPTARKLPPPTSVPGKLLSPISRLSGSCGRPLPPSRKNGEHRPVLPLASGPGRHAELRAAEGGA